MAHSVRARIEGRRLEDNSEGGMGHAEFWKFLDRKHCQATFPFSFELSALNFQLCASSTLALALCSLRLHARTPQPATSNKNSKSQASNLIFGA